MNEILKNFLRENEKLKNQNKTDTLIKLGLCERKYAPEGEDLYGCGEYKEWDSEKQQYYKNIPIEVDDEVYFKILKTTKAKAILNSEGEPPATVKVCYALGTLEFIAGGLLGIIYGVEYESFLVFIGVILVAISSGILYMALGKIVEYLYRINFHISN